MPLMAVSLASRVCTIALIGCCLVSNGCVESSAIDDFAKASAQAAQLFPAFASIAEEGCIAQEKEKQLGKVTEFTRGFAFDQGAIDTACARQKATEQRLAKVYAVLSEYIQTLAKVAGSKTATYDKNVTSLVNSIPGLDATQQAAVAGLASVVADALAKHWRERQAAKAIEIAQPDILIVAKMLDDQMPRLMEASLDNQQDALATLYQEASVFKVNGQTMLSNPILIAKNYTDAEEEIARKRAAVKAFEQIVRKIADAHTALYNARGKLLTRDAMQDLFQTASDIKKQVNAVQAALKE